MNSFTATWILLAHFVGDFVCQNSWMAMGKSKSWKPLAVHIAVYTVVLLAMVGFPYHAFGRRAILWCLVNGGLHCITDFFTARINARNWAKQKYRAFWIGIGADQFIHGACMMLTWGLL